MYRETSQIFNKENITSRCTTICTWRLLIYHRIHRKRTSWITKFNQTHTDFNSSMLCNALEIKTELHGAICKQRTHPREVHRVVFRRIPRCTRSRAKSRICLAWEPKRTKPHDRAIDFNERGRCWVLWWHDKCIWTVPDHPVRRSVTEKKNPPAPEVPETRVSVRISPRSPVIAPVERCVDNEMLSCCPRQGGVRACVRACKRAIAMWPASVFAHVNRSYSFIILFIWAPCICRLLFKLPPAFAMPSSPRPNFHPRWLPIALSGCMMAYNRNVTSPRRIRKTSLFDWSIFSSLHLSLIRGRLVCDATSDCYILVSEAAAAWHQKFERWQRGKMTGNAPKAFWKSPPNLCKVSTRVHFISFKYLVLYLL